MINAEVGKQIVLWLLEILAGIPLHPFLTPDASADGQELADAVERRLTSRLG